MEAENLRDGVEHVEQSSRIRRLKKIAALLSALLLLKVLLAIVVEYRWYFPANFDSAFLTGRREFFTGVYRAAFYTHILSGPLAVLLGSFLMLSGGRSRYRSMHRRAGRAQMAIVFLAIVPSGLVMASEALAGPVAGAGFASLSLATAACAVAAIQSARRRRFLSHRRWATRCFLLLCSPLLLRVFSGAAIVMEHESEWFYRLNAWLSWLIPLAIYEIWLRFPNRCRDHWPVTEHPVPAGKSLSCKLPTATVTDRPLTDLRY